MQRQSSTPTELRQSSFHTVLMAALIFQAVIGSAHLATTVAASDGTRTRVTCLVYNQAGSGEPAGIPDNIDTQRKQACAVCASNQWPNDRPPCHAQIVADRRAHDPERGRTNPGPSEFELTEAPRSP